MTVLIYAQSKDRETLADKLVAYSDLPREEAENLASSEGPGPYDPLPLMDSSAILRDLPEETQRTFRDRSLLLERGIMWSYPLASDEELLEDGLLTTWLSEDAIEYPRGTIAIQRKTNLGEIVFLEQEFTFDIDHKELVDNRPDDSPEALAGATAEAFAMSWASLGLAIAKGLLSALANKIGAGIFERFFGPRVPSYFNQVYQEFRSIVKQEIEQNTLTLLMGEVEAVQNHMIAYVRHRERETWNPEAAQQEIAQAYNVSVQVTSKLLLFPVAGLGPFLTAGGLHLAIIQERALRDTTVNDPNESSWAKIYFDALSKFVPYVASQPDRIVGERARQITRVDFVRRTGGTRSGIFDSSYWWFEDRLLRQRREFPVKRKWTKQLAEDQRTNHYRYHVTVLVDNPLNPAREIARNWQRAMETPLPQVET